VIPLSERNPLMNCPTVAGSPPGRSIVAMWVTSAGDVSGTNSATRINRGEISTASIFPFALMVISHLR
jgi:hypothetical protein